MAQPLGFSYALDNHRSVKWNVGAADKNVNGFTNNRHYNPQASTGGFVDTQTSMQAVANTGVTNGALQYKMARYPNSCCKQYK